MAKVIITVNGTKIYYADNNNDYHREDGPAMIAQNGSLYWILNHKTHNTTYPNFIANGLRAWFYHDNPHRNYKPAKDWPNGYKAWYLDGYKIWPEL